MLPEHKIDKIQPNKLYNRTIKNNNFYKYINNNKLEKKEYGFFCDNEFSGLKLLKKKKLKSRGIKIFSSPHKLKKAPFGKNIKISKSSFQYKTFQINFQKLESKDLKEKINKIINQLSKIDNSSANKEIEELKLLLSKIDKILPKMGKNFLVFYE